MKEIKELNFKKCTTNEEIAKMISNRVEEIPFEDLQKHIAKKFVFSDNILEAIYTGLLLNKNVYISGRGGFGKSEIVKEVLIFYKIPYSVVTGYKDMPVESLLGIPNMDKLLKDSVYEINFEKSVFGNPGILVGEEFGDILPSTAAALKDILSEKGYRFMGKKIESKIGSMIITSNKSPFEIADDDSKKAFYISRFPIKVTVQWKDYSKASYYILLDTTFPTATKLSKLFISKLLANNSIKYDIVSPRTAIEIMEAYLRKGIRFIKNFDIDLSEISELMEEAELEQDILTKESLFKELDKLILEAIVDKDYERLAYYYFIISMSKTPPELISTANRIKNSIKLAIFKYSPHDNLLVKEDDEAT